MLWESVADPAEKTSLKVLFARQDDLQRKLARMASGEVSGDFMSTFEELASVDRQLLELTEPLQGRDLDKYDKSRVIIGKLCSSLGQR